MKVLIICSGHTSSVFVDEQVEALREIGVEIDYFLVSQKGFLGYLRSVAPLKEMINQFCPDLIHAHYGLSGVLANLQRKVSVVVTYHGCDINDLLLRIISIPSLILSSHNIFVSKNQYSKIKFLLRNNYSIIPCGINFSTFKLLNKYEARNILGLIPEKKYILFSSAFDIPVKNYPLAKQSVELLNNVELVELKGYSRKEVNLLMNACDAGLLTSFNEGSPIFVKELLALDKPVVSTDVGDVKERFGHLNGVYITNFEPESVADKLQQALFQNFHLGSREKIAYLDNHQIALLIKEVYNKVLR